MYKRQHLLRNVNGSDAFGVQHLLLPTHELLEEVDSHVVVGRKVHACVGREKIVNFPLRAVLG